MPLFPNDIKKIEKLTESIIAEDGISSPGFSIEHVARKRGLKVMAYDLGAEISGVLVIANGAGTIGVNPQDPKVRQRFTMAHEFGHYIMHAKSLKDKFFVDSNFILKFRSTNPYTPAELKQELEANAFAAALLMPKFLITEEMDKAEYADLRELELIDRLAKVFKVSSAAMTYRLTNLNSV
jgi:Zn-dependent peptidase ImmA (M78 family)